MFRRYSSTLIPQFDALSCTSSSVTVQIMQPQSHTINAAQSRPDLVILNQPVAIRPFSFHVECADQCLEVGLITNQLPMTPVWATSSNVPLNYAAQKHESFPFLSENRNTTRRRRRRPKCITSSGSSQCLWDNRVYLHVLLVAKVHIASRTYSSHVILSC